MPPSVRSDAGPVTVLRGIPSAGALRVRPSITGALVPMAVGVAVNMVDGMPAVTEPSVVARPGPRPAEPGTSPAAGAVWEAGCAPMVGDPDVFCLPTAPAVPGSTAEACANCWPPDWRLPIPASGACPALWAVGGAGGTVGVVLACGRTPFCAAGTVPVAKDTAPGLTPDAGVARPAERSVPLRAAGGTASPPLAKGTERGPASAAGLTVAVGSGTAPWLPGGLSIASEKAVVPGARVLSLPKGTASTGAACPTDPCGATADPGTAGVAGCAPAVPAAVPGVPTVVPPGAVPEGVLPSCPAPFAAATWAAVRAAGDACAPAGCACVPGDMAFCPCVHIPPAGPVGAGTGVPDCV